MIAAWSWLSIHRWFLLRLRNTNVYHWFFRWFLRNFNRHTIFVSSITLLCTTPPWWSPRLFVVDHIIATENSPYKSSVHDRVHLLTNKRPLCGAQLLSRQLTYWIACSWPCSDSVMVIADSLPSRWFSSERRVANISNSCLPLSSMLTPLIDIVPLLPKELDHRVSYQGDLRSMPPFPQG